MALLNDNDMKYAKLGAIAAIATSWVLQFVSQFVSMIPGVNLDLQSVSITTTGVGDVVGTGLSTYAAKLFGIIPVSLSIPEWIFLGIGGAAFMVLGSRVAEAMNLLKGADKTRQLTTIFVVAGITSGWVLSMSIGLPAIPAIATMAVNAYILSWLLIRLDDTLKLGLTK